MYRLFILLCAGLGACSALPASGPTEREVLDAENGGNNPVGFHIVNITPAVVAAVAHAGPPTMARIGNGGAQMRADAIGPGDLLAISIYEVGNGVFSGGGASVAGPSVGDVAGANSSASGTRLPSIQVDARGNISLPFIGRVHAAGRTPAELAEAIRNGLRRVSQDPQVLVTVAESVSESAYVLGDVRNPGRRPLTVNGERLLDVIALSGGSSFPSQDMQIELIRNGHRAQVPLRRLEDDPAENIVVRPADRIRLTYQLRSFTVFGASGKVSELPFVASKVSLAEGVARAGGPQNERADPNAIFLFRFEPAAVAQALDLPPQQDVSMADAQPVVYKLDMMDPSSYFLSQNFPMRDKDLIYIANARTDRFSKFLSMIYNIAFPVGLGRQLAN